MHGKTAPYTKEFFNSQLQFPLEKPDDLNGTEYIQPKWKSSLRSPLFLSVWLCKVILLLQHAHFSYAVFRRLYHFVLKHPILRFLISNRLFRVIQSTLKPFTLLDKE